MHIIHTNTESDRSLLIEPTEAEIKAPLPDSILHLFASLVNAEGDTATPSQNFSECTPAERKIVDHTMAHLRGVLHWSANGADISVAHPSWIGHLWHTIESNVRCLSSSLQLIRAECAAVLAPSSMRPLLRAATTRAEDTAAEMVGIAEYPEFGMHIVCTRTQAGDRLWMVVQIARENGKSASGLQVSVQGVVSGDSTEYTDATGAIRIEVVNEPLEIRVEFKEEQTARRQSLLIPIRATGTTLESSRQPISSE